MLDQSAFRSVCLPSGAGSRCQFSIQSFKKSAEYELKVLVKAINVPSFSQDGYNVIFLGILCIFISQSRMVIGRLVL